MTQMVPFSSIVGQEGMKRALILAAIDPGINGVLLYGEKGTAKSTAARAIARLLPTQRVIKGCQYGCDPDAPSQWCSACRSGQEPLRPQTGHRPTPFVEVPLNATEDRVLGGIDLTKSLLHGKAVFQPGLLAQANRGILYIDEVNLLDKALLNAILDAAASGWHRVEREGVSVSHPSRFVLVGTMNPEEGELDPQILDRIGLCCEVKGAHTIEERVGVLLLHQEMETVGTTRGECTDPRDEELRERIALARSRLATIRIAQGVRTFIAELAASKNVEGHRADIILERASRALCALEGRDTVRTDDVLEVVPLVLAHRARKGGAEQPPPNKQDEQPATEAQPSPKHHSDLHKLNTSNEGQHRQPSKKEVPKDKRRFDIGQEFKVKGLPTPKDRLKRANLGKRLRSRLKIRKGRWSGASAVGESHTHDIAVDATLRAAAPHQPARKQASDTTLAFVIEPEDLRHKRRMGKASTLVLFVVDASGSMGARARMVASKGAVMSLLLDAYRMRDKVAMISFRGTGAKVELHPTSSVEFAASCLKDLAVGGRTPLASALLTAQGLVAKAIAKAPLLRPIVIVVTDGRANVPTTQGRNPVVEAMEVARLVSSDPRVQFVVVDTEDPFALRLGIPKRLAANLGASYFRIEDLRSHDLVSVVHKERNRP